MVANTIISMCDRLAKSKGSAHANRGILFLFAFPFHPGFVELNIKAEAGKIIGGRSLGFTAKLLSVFSSLH